MSSSGVLQFLRKCKTRDVPTDDSSGGNPAAPSSVGPPLTPSGKFLLYPHFALIFGCDA